MASILPVFQGADENYADLERTRILMKAVSRLLDEYSALYGTLAFDDFAVLLVKSAQHAPEILKAKRLTALDAAMSRDLMVRFRGHEVAIPVAQIDQMLAGKNDNPTFGNVREMCGRDCYLAPMSLPASVGTVLDLGANRGLFGLLALVSMGADLVIGVEPTAHYAPIQELLVRANGFAQESAVRYSRFIASPSIEKQDPSRYVSIETIVKEHSIERIGFAKIDIEGSEKDLFSEPEWLSLVENLAMELHPEFAGSLSLIPEALEAHGFAYACTGQFGEPMPFDKAMYLYASRTGCLRDGVTSAR